MSMPPKKIRLTEHSVSDTDSVAGQECEHRLQSTSEHVGPTASTTSSHVAPLCERGGGEPAETSETEGLNAHHEVETEISNLLDRGVILLDTAVTKLFFLKANAENKYFLDPNDLFTVHEKFRGGFPCISNDYTNEREKSDEGSLEEEKVALEIFQDMASCLKYVSVGEGGDQFWSVNTTEVRRHLKHIKTLRTKCAWIYQVGEVLRGFRKRMTSSSGKECLKSIINMAVIVALGEEAVEEQYIKCNTVGSADKSERFPVGEIPSHLYYKGMCSRLLKNTSGSHSSTASTASDSSDTPGMCRVASPAIYADLIVLSGYKPNWPHYIMIGELKGRPITKEGDIDESERRQLIREMLGTLLIQDRVVGILMKDKEAFMCFMKIIKEKKKVDITCHSTYDFVNVDGTFNVTEWNRMFLDMVHAIKLMKNVKKSFLQLENVTDTIKGSFKVAYKTQTPTSSVESSPLSSN